MPPRLSGLKLFFNLINGNAARSIIGAHEAVGPNVDVSRPDVAEGMPHVCLRLF